jgi:hypothetical protein
MIISVANQKRGGAKSTTAINLAAGLTGMSKEVVPQIFPDSSTVLSRMLFGIGLLVIFVVFVPVLTHF